MDRFRVVVLGTSFGRTVQAVAFGRHPGFTLAAIAGAHEEKTRRAARELGLPRCTSGATAPWP